MAYTQLLQPESVYTKLISMSIADYPAENIWVSKIKGQEIKRKMSFKSQLVMVYLTKLFGKIGPKNRESAPRTPRAREKIEEMKVVL